MFFGLSPILKIPSTLSALSPSRSASFFAEASLVLVSSLHLQPSLQAHSSSPVKHYLLSWRCL